MLYNIILSLSLSNLMDTNELTYLSIKEINYFINAFALT